LGCRIIYHLIFSSIQGEYTALCFAGAFSFEDGVKLTKARGEAMQAAADASQCSPLSANFLE
jgi:malonyl CoA-acyl carrier protein transacylase